ncbi:peptidoglycan DD-metalloendopeptidase family protein [Parabacteroides sp. PF5-9]|uniref:peptidoglycan DD-metalloendopeptidase family protein n=1 Tax=Parabacteroides sp. PF5-9 TaxID=1742404 RepID=UPI002476AF72|nr:peptidoglycan DD-metalloendopeptidase family protein [Parabacteroides sp. PF5-9]MDH6358848.1 murein DD-endopeptidase MepM/ murein hydrolase activator NlpD [Parabacteroides sp. PF5-9]
MRKQTILILITLLLLKTGNGYSQELRNPFDFPILLSGNFGELRSNHFHSGIDFKTQGAEGRAIHAVQEGYISQASVSPGGYGNALYITHPDGTTTVYAHLQRFSDPVASSIKEQQYIQEKFAVNILFEPDQFPVEKGEFIALSGNTGSSAGPHLHFEVRDSHTKEVLDPIEYYKESITDNKPPRILGIMIYPFEGEGVVNGSRRKKELLPTAGKDGTLVINPTIEAWGKIGIGVKAYDYMNHTQNIYGVKEIVLKVDSQQVYRSYIDRFGLDKTRYINSFIDYGEWINNRSFYMKSFMEPGNRSTFAESVNRGIITIDENRPYHLTYILTDAFGNSTEMSFQLTGKEQPIPSPYQQSAELFHWRSENRFGAKGIRLTIPKGNLYKDYYFKYSVKEDSTTLSATHQLHDEPVAFHQTAALSLHIQHDTLTHKAQYGIVQLHKGKASWIGGHYRDGWVDANIRELGTYKIAQDKIAPTITPLQSNTWADKHRLVFRLTDNLSGIAHYRGEIDGQYALFEMDNRSVITYQFDNERLSKGEQHRLKLVASDACGNEASYEYAFTW